jgi:hypothetical protein
MDAFVGLPEVERVLGRGSTRSSIRLRSGFQIDLRVVPAESLGAALLYFTGSKGHNVALRQLAIQQGLKLNEYGLFRERRIAGRTERSDASGTARAASCAGSMNRARSTGACPRSSSTGRSAATCRRRPTGPTAPIRSRPWRVPPANSGWSTSRSPITR